MKTNSSPERNWPQDRGTPCTPWGSGTASPCPGSRQQTPPCMRSRHLEPHCQPQGGEEGTADGTDTGRQSHRHHVSLVSSENQAKK